MLCGITLLLSRLEALEMMCGITLQDRGAVFVSVCTEESLVSRPAWKRVQPGIIASAVTRLLAE